MTLNKRLMHGVAQVGLKGLLLAALAVLVRCPLRAQADPLTLPAQRWAADAARNELRVLEYGSTYLRYRMHLVDAKGDLVREVIESKDGPVARLILRGGRELTSDEDHAERDRLQALLDSPEAFAKHIRSEQSGKRQAAEMMKALPDAMLYSYAPGQPQREARATDSVREIVVDFQPNSAWSPPTMVSEALTGLQGRVWVDAATHTMTRIEVRVFRGINLGLGFVAHVYPGGNASFEQVHVAGDRWIFSHFVEHVTVRALMLKTLKEDAEVQGTDFTPVATMGYRDAIQMLLAAPLPTH